MNILVQPNSTFLLKCSSWAEFFVLLACLFSAMNSSFIEVIFHWGGRAAGSIEDKANSAFLSLAIHKCSLLIWIVNRGICGLYESRI